VTYHRLQAPTVRGRRVAVRTPLLDAATAAGPKFEPAGGTHAGRLLCLLSMVPALLCVAWLVVAFPLAALGQFRAVIVVPLALAAAAVIVPLGIGPLRRPAPQLAAPWWTTAATLAVATGFASFVAATHSEQAVLRRDPGSYAQIGLWLTHHPGPTLPIPAEAFGTSWADLAFASPGFYAQDDTIVAQFMTGWPTMLAAANWAAGWQGMFVLPALVGGCMILAVAGLTARLVGARWAPLAALLLAVAWPMLRVSQTTYSEPLAGLVLAGGIFLLLDVLKLVDVVKLRDVFKVVQRPGQDGTGPDPLRRRARGAAFVCGLMLAGGELVRLDMGVDFALIVPVVGWWWLTRRPGAGGFVLGALIGGGLGVADCVFVTLPYVQTNWSSVRPMIVGVVAVVAGTAVVAVALRAWWRPPLELRPGRWLPTAGATAVVVLAAALVLRPFVHVDHSTAAPGVIAYTAEMQGWLGLPIDGTRGYAEQTLWWASWYLGWPLLAVAFIAATVLTSRVIRGREPRWIPVLLVYGVSAVLTLIRPGITPDHPWADRRLVVEVIPAVVLLATWNVAAATRMARTAAADPPRRLGPALRNILARTGQVFPAVVTTVLVAAFVVPMVIATAPVAMKRTELGEVAAASAVCQTLRPGDSVVLLDSLWVPTIRGQCGLPVAQLPDASPASMDRVTSSIRAAGRTPVLGASEPEDLSALRFKPTEVVTLHTRQDQHQLVRRPDSTDPLVIEFWLVRP
jgi:hypothetical protein